MKLVGRNILEQFKKKHADARTSIERWEEVVMAASWRNFADLRRTLSSADQINLDRILVVTVFNIGGNKYRLISEISYTAQIVRPMIMLTHAQYDSGRWKGGLIC